MPKVTYNSTKGLIVESGTSQFLFAQTHNVKQPKEDMDVTSGNGTEVGTGNGVLFVDIANGHRTVTLQDGLAVGQEKFIIMQNNVGSKKLTLKNSDTTTIGAELAASKVAQHFAHLCVWNGEEWLLLG